MATFSQLINAWVSMNSGIVERYLKRPRKDPRTWKNLKCLMKYSEKANLESSIKVAIVGKTETWQM